MALAEFTPIQLTQLLFLWYSNVLKHIFRIFLNNYYHPKLRIKHIFMSYSTCTYIHIYIYLFIIYIYIDSFQFSIQSSSHHSSFAGLWFWWLPSLGHPSWSHLGVHLGMPPGGGGDFIRFGMVGSWKTDGKSDGNGDFWLWPWWYILYIHIIYIISYIYYICIVNITLYIFVILFYYIVLNYIM